jgi:RNA polymerase sigma-70 factor (ECF subfamily)
MSPVRTDDASAEELLARSVTDPEAFGRFYDRFEGELLRFFVRATRRPEIAADLTAEVFALALSGAASFDPARGNARGWLFGIARHELADAWELTRTSAAARLTPDLLSVLVAFLGPPQRVSAAPHPARAASPSGATAAPHP